MDIARRIGVLLCIDRNTVEGDFGYFVRVLVDVDLAKALKYQLILDCENQLL